MKNYEDSRRFRAHRSNQRVSTTHRHTMKDFPIGVFDSGVGGLTVLQQLQDKLPNESFLYFGDTANVPYGGRSPEDLIRLTRRILDWMSTYPVKMAVMACNTSSAWALEHVRHEYAFPILGIILPVAKAAKTLGTRLGVIATQGTVNSACYPQAIQEVDAKISVFQMPCPEFVPLIEQGRLDDRETYQAIERRLRPLIDSDIDALIYGCTHYPHLRKAIRHCLPPSIQLVDPAIYIAEAVQQELSLLRLTANTGFSTTEFFVSAAPEHFAKQMRCLINMSPQVHQVDLGCPQIIPLVS